MPTMSSAAYDGRAPSTSRRGQAARPHPRRGPPPLPRRGLRGDRPWVPWPATPACRSRPVYKAFRNKAGLLKSVFDVAIAGDDEPVPMMERRLRGGHPAPTPEAADKLRMYADHLAGALPRTVRPSSCWPGRRPPPIRRSPRSGHQMQHERLFGHDRRSPPTSTSPGQLRPGVTATSPATSSGHTTRSSMYDLLVLARGWSIDQYRTSWATP